MLFRAALLLPALLALAPASQTAAPVAPPAAAESVPVEVAEIVRTYPHDTKAFTEGLFIDRGELFESTGQQGLSSVRRVDLASGRVLRSVKVAPPYFGEGIAPWNGQILSLTWRDGVGFRWDRKTFRKIGTFRYEGEGWALTAAPRELVMSDGTDVLRFIDPQTFAVKRRVSVTIRGKPLRMLNEIEWVDGLVYANVWLTDAAVKIDPVSGKVVGVIDLRALHQAAGAFGEEQVANGIAWDAKTRKLYMTGKEWPSLFEVRLVPAPAQK